jgi:hypothetical protein
MHCHSLHFQVHLLAVPAVNCGQRFEDAGLISLSCLPEGVAVCSAASATMSVSNAVEQSYNLMYRSRSANWLMQLPKPALGLVLQNLDQGSLACTAVTCSTLRKAVFKTITRLAVHCRVQGPLRSLLDWSEKPSSSLSDLQQCSIINNAEEWDAPPCLPNLPCPQLRQLHQLHVESLIVHLEPAGGLPGVLHACSGLTELHLQGCLVRDGPAAAAAIAALHKLQSLKLAELWSVQPIAQPIRPLFEELRLPLQLTHLSLGLRNAEWYEDLSAEAAANLSQLSGLVNLAHLRLIGVPRSALPGGFPLQLVRLTSLDISYDSGCDTAEQFQHLSSLTALQQLSVHCCGNLDADHLWGLQQLSQLTGLQLDARGLFFNTTSTQSWACLTALQSLALRCCSVQPEALAGLTQMRSLLEHVQHLAAPEQLMNAVSQLSLLTQLTFQPGSAQGH